MTTDSAAEPELYVPFATLSRWPNSEANVSG